MRFLAKKMSVEAEQFLLTREWPDKIIELNPFFKQRVFSFGTKERHEPISPGDWIIDNKFVVPDRLFRKLFVDDNI